MQSVTIRELDALWRDGHGQEWTLRLDLSDAVYVAHDVLLYLVGIFQHRTSRGQSSRLTLPRDPRVVDFLRAWGLPAALEEITGLRFVDLIDDDSRAAWHGLPPASRYERVIDKPGGGRETMLPKSFFALTPLRVPLESLPAAVRGSAWRTAALERDRWLQSHVVSVLDLYLSRRGDEIATRVVYEAVLNAARHPAATLGFVSAQLVRQRAGARFGEPTAIEICIWDNGRAYAETLGDRLQSGGTIYSEAYRKKHEVFDLTVVNGSGNAPFRAQLTDQDTAPPTTSEALTVAAFMLGVTSRPDRSDELPLDDPAFASASTEPAGTGLYYVRKTVIDKFGGSIHYISKDLRMRLSGGLEVNSYHAEVHRSQNDYAPVAGNLLVTRIPVKSGLRGHIER